MLSVRSILMVCLSAVKWMAYANQLPTFVHDMNNIQIQESTKPGSFIYRLLAEDAESELYYSITDTDAFHVERTTGVVTLARFLNSKTEPEIRFTVSCEDLPVNGASNKVSKYVIVRIVGKVNSNPPTFRPSILNINIDKNTAPGTVLASYSAVDIDSLGQPLSVSCGKVQGRPSRIDICKFFTFLYKAQTINDVDVDLILLKQLSDLVETEFFFFLTVSDGSLFSSITVRLSLIESNEISTATAATPAAFVTEEIQEAVFISQTVHISTAVVTTSSIIKASTTSQMAMPVVADELTTAVHQIEVEPLYSDITFQPAKAKLGIQENYPISFPLPFNPRLRINYDSPNYVGLSVKMLNSQEMGMFALEPSVLYADRNFDVVVVDSSALDRELHSRIELLIEATDLSNKTMRQQMQLTIDIADVNDNYPTFLQSEYNISLSDDAQPGTLLGQISAHDPDSQLFGTKGLVFHLVGNWAKYFRLTDKASGVVELFASPCDSLSAGECLSYRDFPDQAIAVIRATDNNGTGLFTDVPLVFNLVRHNIAKPQFPQALYVAKLREKDTQFDPVLILEATDDDSDVLTYGLEDPTHLFDIDKETGLVFVAKPNHVTINNLGVKFSINGTVSDGVNEVVKTKILIELMREDASDTAVNKPPVFSLQEYVAIVPPTSHKGYVVVNVIATDPEDRTVHYFLSSGGSGYFSVNQTTGEITFSGEKFGADKNFTLEVLALDDGTPQAYSAVTVAVICTGIRSNPPKFVKNVFIASIPENATVGLAVEVPQVVDSDAIDGYQMSVISEQAFGRFGDPLSIGSTQFFDFDDGALILQQSVLSEEIFSFYLTIAAVDKAHSLEEPAKAVVVVNVVQNAIKVELPEFKFLGVDSNETLHINISSDTPAKAFIYHFRMFDTNPLSLITFAFVNFTDQFLLDERSGLLILKKQLDGNRKSQYVLQVDATNSKTQQTATVILVVHVIEKRNFVKLALDANSYSINIIENNPIGSFVLRPTIVAQFCSSFEYKLSGNDSTYFFIDSNARILTAAKIDREIKETFTFDLEVACREVWDNTSSNIISTIAPVIVNVLDLNDNPPLFDKEEYSFTVQDNLPMDTYVGMVHSVDPDKGINGTISYSFGSVPSEIRELIVMNSATGQMKTVKSFKNVVGLFKLTASAIDGGNLNSTVHVNLTVLRSNQCTPRFVSSNGSDVIMSVKENENPGVVLAQFKAITDDSKCSIKYAFRDSSTGQAYGFTDEFQVNAESGVLSTKKSLDRERKAKYNFVMSAMDGVNNETIPAQMFVEVNVEDLNDNEPEFLPSAGFNIDNCTEPERSGAACWFEKPFLQYNFTIFENEPVGTVIAKITATDPDEDVNGQVYYYLADSANLEISATSGVLKSKVSFDREKQQVVETYVFSTNVAKPPSKKVQEELLKKSTELKNVAKLMITILDRNDVGPSFDKKVYLGAISSEVSSESLVLRVRAVDPDVSGGGVNYKLKKTEYHYKKSSVAEQGKFFVDGLNGEVKTKSDLNEFSQGFFQLTVESANDDNGTTNLTDLCTVKIWVFEPTQLVRIVVNQSPVNITDKANTIATVFGDSFGANVVLQGIEYNRDKQGTITKDKVDFLAVFIDRTTEEIMDTDRVLNLVDKIGLPTLSYASFDFSIEEILPGKLSRDDQSSGVSGAAVALIVFGCILFLGLLAFLLLLCYLKYSFIQELKVFRSLQAASSRTLPAVFLASKENPLWNEPEKKKPYEEQEFSIPVVNDEGTYARGVVKNVNVDVSSINSKPDYDNFTYAKIHKPQSSRYSPTSSINTEEYDGANLYQSLRK